ncbi:hypothetical protein [Nostoc sp. LEGE 06077]|nr:hypothetical protein [Nostoc sp. LEGE 06077]
MARPPIHPGEILGDEITEIGMTASDLARVLYVPMIILSPEEEAIIKWQM